MSDEKVLTLSQDVDPPRCRLLTGCAAGRHAVGCPASMRALVEVAHG